MRTRLLTALLDELCRLDIDDHSRRQVRALVQRLAIDEGITTIERRQRVDFARNLLSLDVSRPMIRDRLKAAYGISERQAYRVMEAALDSAINRANVARDGG